MLGLVREKYGGPVGERFGPTLAAEQLASEDGQRVDAETLRRWMLEEGLWSRERRRRRHRRRRERKAHFGEMVQMDGSFHAWLEDRGPEGCLIDMVDDASNKTWAQLGEQETIWAVADALRAWIERYGVPLALYVDWKNLYKRPANAGERKRGEEPVTQFGRMCGKLGVTLIAANSPQAKGRVERQHGTHQDRLVKKLRRRGIYSYEGSNVFLEREYLPEHNQRFGRCAARPEDYHRKAPCAAELDRIFRLESERTVSDDWVVRYDNRFFQLEPQSGHIVPARSKVWVCEGRYGRMSIESGGRALRWREIAAPVQPQGLETAARKATPRVPISVKKRKWTPPPSHPGSAYGWTALYPVVVRGEAYLAAHQGSEAATEFQKILEHRGTVVNSPIGALAHLQLGRAYAMQGDTAKAKATYQDFLTLWKGADPDIPILKQAEAEYAKLH